MSKYCTVYFLTGDRVWLELSFCCILWLVARLTPRFFFLTVGRLLCLTIVPSISDWWQLLALFEYCTIFFWLVTDFVPVWVLYHLFLTGERFWPCLSIVPSFSDWWQVCSVWELHHLFWLLTGFGPGWVFYIFFWLVTGFGSVWVLNHLFLTGDRFWPCLSIVPSFSDWWQVFALFQYCTMFFWLLAGFGPVWELYHLFLTGDRFWPCLSIVPSFSDFDRSCSVWVLYCLSDCYQVLALFEYSTIFSDVWQVLALYEYCTIFFWLVTDFGPVWVLYHLFLTGDRFWLCFEYCTIFFCFQVLALFEYCTIFFWIVTGFAYV